MTHSIPLRRCRCTRFGPEPLRKRSAKLLPQRRAWFANALRLLAATVLLSGCSDTTGPAATANHLTATVDGEPFVASSYLDAAVGADEILVLRGALAVGVGGRRQINLYLPASVSMGTLSLVADQRTYGEYVDLEQGGFGFWDTFVVGSTGSVSITELTSTLIAGTFAFTVPASPDAGIPTSKTVTNGSFRLPLH
jgi:hypothetical protein